jgi:uncharacterized membrane protein YgcG
MVPAMSRLRILAAMMISACSLSGCLRVPAYQRETLARRDMAIADDPALTAGEEHGREYREGSRGGGSTGGGGCGCN